MDTGLQTILVLYMLSTRGVETLTEVRGEAPEVEGGRLTIVGIPEKAVNSRNLQQRNFWSLANTEAGKQSPAASPGYPARSSSLPMELLPCPGWFPLLAREIPVPLPDSSPRNSLFEPIPIKNLVVW
jgi:hypothetical protein